MAKQVINTAADLGAAAGAMDGAMALACIKPHTAYVALKDEAEKAIQRRNFKVNYVVHYAKTHKIACDYAAAEKAVDAGKRAAGKLGAAVNSAGAMCTKWLVNGGGKTAAQTVAAKLSKAQLAHIKAGAAMGIDMRMYGQGMQQLGIKAAK